MVRGAWLVVRGSWCLIYLLREQWQWRWKFQWTSWCVMRGAWILDDRKNKEALNELAPLYDLRYVPQTEYCVILIMKTGKSTSWFPCRI